ncbi:hypothetical protein N7508_006125 [Penicillium antarcticum]|uniref:uncharacterized protein n=1 Tax=Penicillium antarcticum TaxID=416450 RepID=UPI002381E8D9|nr:uncharacterized protein N7508_006125 [Penicillium antarcticum]KAJ5301262.1 hypothetical protein N7508_006125 [Penicillium antarcticum]
MSCEACRTIPPVTSQGYTPEGHYETIAGLKTYVTGNMDGKMGLVDLYDVFGLAIQTLQGADLLAVRLNAVVLVPDFFEGDPLKPEYVPADTEEKKKIIAEFLDNKASFSRNAALLLEAVEEYKSRFPSVGKWGAFGLCWGGKVTVIASGANSPFAASGQVHPGRMDVADAALISIPHIVLASKDEPADAVTGYAKVIDSNELGGHVETFSTMWHGWMGARADLDGEESRSEYMRGYLQLAEFFEKHLQ